MGNSVNIKVPAALRQRIQSRFEFVINDKKMLKEIGQFSADRLRYFMRVGRSIVSGKPFAPYSKSYMLTRTGVAKFRTVKHGDKKWVVPFDGPDEILMYVDKQFYNPTSRKARLTLTGQMAKSIGTIAIGNGRVQVGPRGKRKNPRHIKDTKINKSNAELAKIHNEGLNPKIPKREFLGMDDKGIKRIKNIVLKTLRRALLK